MSDLKKALEIIEEEKKALNQDISVERLFDVFNSFDKIEKSSGEAVKTLKSFVEKKVENSNKKKIEATNGKAEIISVAPSFDIIYGEETKKFLEKNNLFSVCVDINATLKNDVDVESIPDNELEIISRYFELEFTPSPKKLQALISLGKLNAVELEKTAEKVQKRAGYKKTIIDRYE